MLNESLNQFKLDSTHFQQAFNNVERPVQTPPTFGSTTVQSVAWLVMNHENLSKTFNL